MIISYPLKTTQENGFYQVFENYITQNYGPQAWAPVQKPFQKMAELRSNLDFQKYNVALAKDAQSCQLLEENIYEYFRYAGLVSSKFRFEQFQQGRVEINFPWTDSFSPQKTIVAQQMKYELCCIMYNFAIVEYCYGCNLMEMNQPDKRKEAIRKFRQGIWAIKEVQRASNALPADVKTNSQDFKIENVSILENMFFGLIYSCLYQNLHDQAKQLGGIQNVVQLAGESAKYFSIAKSMADSIFSGGNQGYPADLVQFIRAKCNYYFAYYTGITARKLATYHESVIEDDALGKHMGFALSYLIKGDQVLKKIKEDVHVLKAMPQPYQQSLNGLHQEFLSELPAAQQRNTQIYKDAIIPAEQLPACKITFDNLKNLGGVRPTELETRPPGCEGFEGFLNEEQVALMNECKSTTEQRQQELNQALQTLSDNKNQAYQDNGVNSHMDLNAIQFSQVVALPNTIAQALQTIRSKGGKGGLDAKIQAIREQQCGNMIQNITQMIKQESDFDAQMRQKHGQAWTRQESNVSNQEYVKKIEDFEKKYSMAQQIDIDVQKKYGSLTNELLICQKTDQEIAALLPQSTNTQFQQQNQQQLQQLLQLDQQLNQCLAQIKGKNSGLQQSNINFAQQVQTCITQGIETTKIKDKVLAEFFKQIEEINKEMDTFCSLLTQLCNLAQELNQKKALSGSQVGPNQQENISGGLARIASLFDEVDGGNNFYQQLIDRLLTLDKQIKDYCMARDLEQQNLQQMIGNQQQLQAAQNQNPFGTQIQNPYQVQQQQVQQSPFQNFQQSGTSSNNQVCQQQQFFNPQTNQFPTGQSYFPGQQQPYN